MDESPRHYGTVEHDVPHTAGLFHPIDALHKVVYPVLLAGCFESLRLFHVLLLLLWEDGVQEGCLDVKLVELPVEGGSNVGDDA
jgi:hypothetical protein